MDIDLNNGVIFIDDLKLGPLGQRNSIRHRTYTSARHGHCVCWIPKRTVLVNIKHHKHLLADELIVNRLKDLFSKGRCSLSREALCIMAAFNLHNYGGSGKATKMIIASAYKALFFDIGFKVDSSKLAKGCPSQCQLLSAWSSEIT